MHDDWIVVILLDFQKKKKNCEFMSRNLFDFQNLNNFAFYLEYDKLFTFFNEIVQIYRLPHGC